MNSLISTLPNVEKFKNYLESIKLGNKENGIFGVTDTAKVMFSYATFKFTEKPICIITYNELQAKKLIKDLSFFSDMAEICFFPKKEIITYDIYAESMDYLHERVNVLNKIYNSKKLIIVTTIEAISQKMITKDLLYKDILKIKVGDTLELEEIKIRLVNLGYKRCELIEGKGQFTVRGGIIDFSPADSDMAIRIELWGDTVDSIRYFDTVTQRSTENINEITIFPAHENLNQGQNEDIFIDYLDANYLLFIDEELKVKQRLTSIIKDNERIIEDLIERQKQVPESLLNIINYEEIEKRLETRVKTRLSNFQNMHAKRNEYSFSCREVNFFRSELNILFKEIKEAKKQNKNVVILGGNKDNCKNISEILFDEDITNIDVREGHLSVGVECEELNLLIISFNDDVGASAHRRPKNTVFKNSEKIVFADLTIGDYVVHKVHGIGQFVGVNTMKTEGIIKDYIKIKYKGTDFLYVPTDGLDSVRKYIGGGEGAPKLNKFGGKDWENTKNKVKANLEEVAKELVELYAVRQKVKGFAFSKDTVWQTEFEEKFPYTETIDQLRSIEEVKKDMEEQKPMDRLLCGDVGFGKTEVAIRGTFKAVNDGKQVAYLVPTTILANQQYESFKDRMKDFPIKIELLNRFRTKKEQTEIIKKLKLGELDIVIGTHRLLQQDVEFKDLGLLIIDEEHRFGVKDKEKIKALKTNVDVLTMTATPIPRTLHMSIVGVRDMSCLYEPPQNRREVQTYVLEYDEEVIKEAITKELEREGQIFYLYNKVETIIKKAEEIKTLIPEAKVGFAHGQMTGNELENIMLEFINKKLDILICTTILESGIDIPNANTIIVENADKLGLAQLYQIRGRVGRADRQAYAYITYKRDKLLTEVADKRLRAIKEFTEFGSGFKIAMRDLEIRGAR